MNSPATIREPDGCRRRWVPRISLRSLLVLVTLLAIGLACAGNLWHRVSKQRRIVSQVVAAGGRATYDYEFVTEGELDYALDPDQATIWTDILSLESDNQPRSRYRRNASGKVVERQVETPPGPWLIRRLLGDDVFSYVETVSFAWADAPGALNPGILLELPRLKVVVLRGRQVSDEWLACVAQVPELRVLALYGDAQSTATSSGLARLRQAKQLESLSLAGEWVQDANLRGIAGLTQLKSLSLGQVPNATSAVFANLGQLTELRQLILLKAPKVDDRETEHLRRLHKLRTLWLVDTSISNATLAHLAELKQLEWLDLEGANIGDQGVEQLATLAELKRLNLGKTGVTDAGVEYLVRLRQLRHLKLGGTWISDGGLATLGAMTQLESLELWPSAITDDGLASLRSLQNLKQFSVGPHVNIEAANKLRQALPQCEVHRVNAEGHASYPEP